MAKQESIFKDHSWDEHTGINSPCMSLARSEFAKGAALRSEGGTAIIAFNPRMSRGTHVTFVPFLTPEQLETATFFTTEPVPGGGVDHIEHVFGLNSYRQRWRTAEVQTVFIKPGDDFNNSVKETIQDWLRNQS